MPTAGELGSAVPSGEAAAAAAAVAATAAAPVAREEVKGAATSTVPAAAAAAAQWVLLTVRRAEELHNVELLARMDPYVEVHVRGRGAEDAVARSRVHASGGRAPSWEQTLGPLELLPHEDEVSRAEQSAACLCSKSLQGKADDRSG